MQEDCQRVVNLALQYSWYIFPDYHSEPSHAFYLLNFVSTLRMQDLVFQGHTLEKVTEQLETYEHCLEASNFFQVAQTSH